MAGTSKSKANDKPKLHVRVECAHDLRNMDTELHCGLTIGFAWRPVPEAQRPADYKVIQFESNDQARQIRNIVQDVFPHPPDEGL